MDKRYGRAVDWWAFGVLIYQMLLQQSPFRGDDEDEIYDAILSDEPLYPIHMPRDSVSILQKVDWWLLYLGCVADIFFKAPYQRTRAAPWCWAQ
jgi:serine/threonine protein kinase